MDEEPFDENIPRVSKAGKNISFEEYNACFVCFAIEKEDNLLRCTVCDGTYHAECFEKAPKETSSWVCSDVCNTHLKGKSTSKDNSLQQSSTAIRTHLFLTELEEIARVLTPPVKSAIFFIYCFSLLILILFHLNY